MMKRYYLGALGGVFLFTTQDSPAYLIEHRRQACRRICRSFKPCAIQEIHHFCLKHCAGLPLIPKKPYLNCGTTKMLSFKEGEKQNQQSYSKATAEKDIQEAMNKLSTSILLCASDSPLNLYLLGKKYTPARELASQICGRKKS